MMLYSAAPDQVPSADRRRFARPIVAAIALRDQVGKLGTDQGWQEFPEHDGLIVSEQFA
jgi:hypothetical protein